MDGGDRERLARLELQACPLEGVRAPVSDGRQLGMHAERLFKAPAALRRLEAHAHHVRLVPVGLHRGEEAASVVREVQPHARRRRVDHGLVGGKRRGSRVGGVQLHPVKCMLAPLRRWSELDVEKRNMSDFGTG